MLEQETIGQILDEYVEDFIPAMLRWRYHLSLVKGGPEYPHLPEQSHFAHIINGVFGLAELLKFLVTERVFVAGLDEETVRKALALYTVHEVHKANDYDKLDKWEFGIPLKRLREEYDRLGLSEFAAVDKHLMRMANVHKRSPKQGDVLLSDEDGSLLWLLVRLADNFASAKMPAEARSSLTGYLKNLGPAFVPKSPPGKYTLYYHEIKDVRGVLTNTIHQVVAQQLREMYRFHPLLYFATGMLYLGPATLDAFKHERFIEKVVTRVLGTLAGYGDSTDAIKGGLRRQKFDFERYIYAFASVPTLLEVVKDETRIAKPNAKVAISEIDGLVRKRTDLPDSWRDSVEERFAIRLLDPKDHKTFNEHWSWVRRYLLYVDTLLRDLNPGEDRLEWFLKAFDVPQSAADNLRAEANIWARGGMGKYVLIIAYHFLRGGDFSDRSAEALPPEQVLERLHQRILAAMEKVDTRAGRQGAVATLGFRQDLTTYLVENLHLSFAPAAQLTDDALAAYTTVKRKGHSRKMCSLCNRQSKYVQDLRTGILDDFGRVFSNRVLPAREAPGGNRPWCPLCHLEFIFRKLTGLGLPPGATYKKSYRIYLYVLPTFSFTPEHLRLFRPLFRQFDRVTGLPVRDYGKEWGVPHHWLVRRELDPKWVADLTEVLERQTEKIAGWGGRRFVGERVMIGHTVGQPHYYLITWEKPARDNEPDDARIATRTEAWAKALFAAVVISGLTACKVYVTERPYLPIADPADLKPTITLDSPPPVLCGMLGGRTDAVSLYGRERGERSGLERALDLSAALWTVTADVHASNRTTKDKYIAGRLGLVNVEPLAGAHFYKEYSRQNDGQTPYSPLDIACEVLLEIQGGELMNLVAEIGEKALAVRLPFRVYGRGKIHNYELAFREGVDALRKGFALIPELRQTALTGKKPPAQAIAELKDLASGTLLKAMERRAATKRGEGAINPWRGNLNQLTRDLIDIIVDEVYLNRAGGSFARFLRLENSLADGVYYYTDRNLSRLWDKYNKQKATRKSKEAIERPQS